MIIKSAKSAELREPQRVCDRCVEEITTQHARAAEHATALARQALGLPAEAAPAPPGVMGGGSGAAPPSAAAAGAAPPSPGQAPAAQAQVPMQLQGLAAAAALSAAKRKSAFGAGGEPARPPPQLVSPPAPTFTTVSEDAEDAESDEELEQTQESSHSSGPPTRAAPVPPAFSPRPLGPPPSGPPPALTPASPVALTSAPSPSVAAAAPAPEASGSSPVAAPPSRALPTPPPRPLPAPPAATSTLVPCCKALYPYPASSSDDLPLSVGQLVQIVRKDVSGWWTGMDAQGRRGTFPSNYVEELPEKIEFVVQGQAQPLPPTPAPLPPVPVPASAPAPAAAAAPAPVTAAAVAAAPVVAAVPVEPSPPAAAPTSAPAAAVPPPAVVAAASPPPPKPTPPPAAAAPSAAAPPAPSAAAAAAPAASPFPSLRPAASKASYGAPPAATAAAPAAAGSGGGGQCSECACTTFVPNPFKPTVRGVASHRVASRCQCHLRLLLCGGCVAMPLSAGRADSSPPPALSLLPSPSLCADLQGLSPQQKLARISSIPWAPWTHAFDCLETTPRRRMRHFSFFVSLLLPALFFSSLGFVFVFVFVRAAHSLRLSHRGVLFSLPSRSFTSLSAHPALLPQSAHQSICSVCPALCSSRPCSIVVLSRSPTPVLRRSLLVPASTCII